MAQLREHLVARVLASDHLPEAASVLAAVALPLVRQGVVLSSAFGTCVLMSTQHPRLIASADRQVYLDRAVTSWV